MTQIRKSNKYVKKGRGLMKAGFFKKILAIICIIACCVPALSASVSAGNDCRIKFSYIKDGVEISLYKIAQSKGMEPEGKFEGCKVSIDENGAAMALAVYAQINNIKADVVKSTNSNNTATFEGLSEGMYLITGDSFISGNKKYTLMPALVTVYEGENDITGKYETADITGDSEDHKLAVMKVWSGSEGESEVTVQLIENGNIYDEVKLNKENNWRHTWTGLNKTSDWTVAEKDVDDKYRVSIEKDGDVFIILNHYTPSGDQTETTSESTTEETTTETTTVTETTTKAPGEGGDNPLTETSTADEGTTESTTERVTEGVTESTTDGETEETTKSYRPGGGHGVESNPTTEGTTEEDKTETITKDEGRNEDRKNDDEPETSDTHEEESVDLTDEEKDSEVNTNNESGIVVNVETSTEADTEKTEDVTTSEKLPQTGQLWTPVPVMAFAGILFILFGMRERQLEDQYEEG